MSVISFWEIYHDNCEHADWCASVDICVQFCVCLNERKGNAECAFTTLEGDEIFEDFSFFKELFHYLTENH